MASTYMYRCRFSGSLIFCRYVFFQGVELQKPTSQTHCVFNFLLEVSSVPLGLNTQRLSTFLGSWFPFGTPYTTGI